MSNETSEPLAQPNSLPPDAPAPQDTPEVTPEDTTQVTAEDTTQVEEPSAPSEPAPDASDTPSDDSAEPAAEETPSEPTEFDVDGEQISLDDLKDAWKLSAKAQEALDTAKQRIDDINHVAENLVEKPMESLLNLFSTKFGDKKKAYDHVVSLCEKVVAQHLQWESLPEAERRAKEKEQEADDLRRQLKERDAALAAEKEQAEIVTTAKQIAGEISAAFKKTGTEKPSPRAIAQVAEIISRAEDNGLTVTYEKAIAAYNRALARQKADLLKELSPSDLTPEQRAAVAKTNIQQIKDTRRPGAKTTPPPAKPERRDPAVVIPSVDIQDYLLGRKR